MLWAIYCIDKYCIDKADTAALRAQHMGPHLDYLDQRKSILVLAGAIADRRRLDSDREPIHHQPANAFGG
jgi:hypothetical protein